MLPSDRHRLSLLESKEESSAVMEEHRALVCARSKLNVRLVLVVLCSEDGGDPVLIIHLDACL